MKVLITRMFNVNKYAILLIPFVAEAPYFLLEKCLPTAAGYDQKHW